MAGHKFNRRTDLVTRASANAVHSIHLSQVHAAHLVPQVAKVIVLNMLTPYVRRGLLRQSSPIEQSTFSSSAPPRRLPANISLISIEHGMWLSFPTNQPITVSAHHRCSETLHNRDKHHAAACVALTSYQPMITTRESYHAP